MTSPPGYQGFQKAEFTSPIQVWTLPNVSMPTGSDRVLMVHATCRRDVLSVTLDPGGANEVVLAQGFKVLISGQSNSLWYLLDAQIPAGGPFDIELRQSSTGRGGLGATKWDSLDQSGPINPLTATDASANRIAQDFTTTKNNNLVISHGYNASGGSWSHYPQVGEEMFTTQGGPEIGGAYTSEQRTPAAQVNVWHESTTAVPTFMSIGTIEFPYNFGQTPPASAAAMMAL